MSSINLGARSLQTPGEALAATTSLNPHIELGLEINPTKKRRQECRTQPGTFPRVRAPARGRRAVSIQEPRPKKARASCFPQHPATETAAHRSPVARPWLSSRGSHR